MKTPTRRWFVTIHPWPDAGLARLRSLGRIHAVEKPCLGDYGESFYCFVWAKTEAGAERKGYSLWKDRYR